MSKIYKFLPIIKDYPSLIPISSVPQLLKIENGLNTMIPLDLTNYDFQIFAHDAQNGIPVYNADGSSWTYNESVIGFLIASNT